MKHIVYTNDYKLSFIDTFRRIVQRILYDNSQAYSENSTPKTVLVQLILLKVKKKIKNQRINIVEVNKYNLASFLSSGFIENGQMVEKYQINIPAVHGRNFIGYTDNEKVKILVDSNVLSIKTKNKAPS